LLLAPVALFILHCYNWLATGYDKEKYPCHPERSEGSSVVIP